MPEQSSPLDLAEGDPFGPHNLPYGVFSAPDHPGVRRVGVRIGNHVLDAGAAAHALGSPYAGLLAQPSLTPLLAAGRTAWSDVRRALTAWLTVPAHRADIEPLLHPVTRRCTCRTRWRTTSTSTRASTTPPTSRKIFRPDGDALTPANWKHLPIGDHGRSGTDRRPGTDVVRPNGQRKAPRTRRSSASMSSTSKSRSELLRGARRRATAGPGVVDPDSEARVRTSPERDGRPSPERAAGPC
ncbi:hypothetical protein SCALM49S_07378 [Streptomyces californicus]